MIRIAPATMAMLAADHSGHCELWDDQSVATHREGKATGQGSTDSGQAHRDHRHPDPRHRLPTASSEDPPRPTSSAVPSSESTSPGIDLGLNRSPATRKWAEATVAIGIRATRRRGCRDVLEPDSEQDIGQAQRQHSQHRASCPLPRIGGAESPPGAEDHEEDGIPHPNRIVTTIEVDNPLVSRARVSTTAEPHPRVATTSGVY